jgi:hypothetical protein
MRIVTSLPRSCELMIIEVRHGTDTTSCTPPIFVPRIDSMFLVDTFFVLIFDGSNVVNVVLPVAAVDA